MKERAVDMVVAETKAAAVAFCRRNGLPSFLGVPREKAAEWLVGTRGARVAVVVTREDGDWEAFRRVMAIREAVEVAIYDDHTETGQATWP